MTLKVQSRRCDTCIYRKDSDYNPALQMLLDEVRDPHMDFRTFRACHHAPGRDVCCRGFWDHHKDEFQMGQVAQRLGLVEMVEVDDIPPPYRRRDADDV